MAKKLQSFQLNVDKIVIDNSDGVKGYLLGSVNINGAPFHVEAVQVNRHCNAVNSDYQDRIDRYAEAEDNLEPHTVKIGSKDYFLSITPYAA